MTFTAGRFLCGKIRSFLDSCKFKGMEIDYIESSGFLQREFTIKGVDRDMLEISKSLHNWAKDNDLKG